MIQIEVFISHTDEDRQVVEKFKVYIENTGAKVKLHSYTIDPEKTIIEKIKQAIKKCDIGVILWTRNSQGREWIIQEIGALAIVNKPMVVLLEPGIDPPGAMAVGLHYIRLDSEEALESFKKWIEKIILKKALVTLILIVLGAAALYLLFRKK